MVSHPRIRRAVAVLVAMAGIVGGGYAATTIMSNLLEYPGSVNDEITVAATKLGDSGTNLRWFVGVEKNVSVRVTPNGYIGDAHVVYEVAAPGVTCADVTVSPLPDLGSSATCTAATDLIRFDTNPLAFDGTTQRNWYLRMTVNRGFTSLTLRIYAVQG